MEPPERIEVSEADVSCEGEGGPLGHPRVFLKIGPEGFVECPYCDRRFVLAGEARRARGH